LANSCPGGIDEIIIDQINGEIADINDHENFAERIKHALYKTVDKVNIRESIKSRFSKEIILRKYEDLLWNI